MVQQKVSVVIPHINCEIIYRCVETLIQKTNLLGRIVIVDQSTNGLDLNKLHKDVSLVINTRGRNLGFAAASNLGLSLCRYDKYVMLCNDDVEFVDRFWFEKILEGFERFENALCISPSSLFNPVIWGEEYKSSSGALSPSEIDQEYIDSIRKGSYMDSIAMYAPVFDMEAFEHIKGTHQDLFLDERFWPSGGEDYDLNRRAYLSGYRCIGIGSSFVWHYWHQSEGPNNKIGKPRFSEGDPFRNKYKTETEDPDLFGKRGNPDVPLNIRRDPYCGK